MDSHESERVCVRTSHILVILGWFKNICLSCLSFRRTGCEIWIPPWWLSPEVVIPILWVEADNAHSMYFYSKSSFYSHAHHCRRLSQAVLLEKITSLDLVVNITLPEHVLTQKAVSRRVCSDCGQHLIVEGELLIVIPFGWAVSFVRFSKYASC